MKKSVSFESVLEKQIKDKDIKLMFDERRFYLQVARLISDLRAKTGISQAELAKRAKVNQPLIARLEVGDKRRAPSFDTVFKILKALGYKMEINVRPDSRQAA